MPTATFTFHFDEQTQHELAVLAAEAGSPNAALVRAIHETHQQRAAERARQESAR